MQVFVISNCNVEINKIDFSFILIILQRKRENSALINMNADSKNIKLFQDEKFSSSDFVNNLIEKMLSNDVDFTSLEKCNLSDLNKVLESTLKELKNLKEEVNHEMEGIKLDREVNHSSLERNQEKLAGDMIEMKNEFESLEKTIAKFTDKSIVIGNSLAQFDKEKQAALLTSELIEYFVAFNGSDLSKIPDFFKDPKTYEIAAKYLYYLNEVGKTLTSSEFSIGIKNVQEKYDIVKQTLLSEYIDGLNKRDSLKLQCLLDLIVDYNILQEVATHYLSYLLRSITREIIYELRSFEENRKSIESTIVNLMRILKNDLINEDNYFMIILEDKGVDIIKQYILIIFESYISKALERVILSFGKNEELYLKYYEIIFIKAQEITQDISKIDSPQASLLYETARAYFHNTFDEYQANYFQYESHFLTSLLEKNTERIQKQLEKQKEKELQIVKQMNFVEKTINVRNINKIEKFRLSKEEVASRIELLRDILMHEGIEIMFSSLDQSIQRCLNLCRFDEKNNNAIILTTKFLEVFGSFLLSSLVDFTSQLVPDLSRKTELNENFFELIFKLNSLVQRVEISIYKAAKEIIKDRKFEQLMEKKEKILHSLEQKIERTLQKAITSLIISANRLLVASQEKNEYYIKGGKSSHGTSSATNNLLKFVTPYVNQIQNSYSENIKRRILSLLGLQLVGILIDHFGESKINRQGMVIIEEEIEEYEKFFDEFDDQNVMNEFETLKSLIHIYKIESKEVDDYIINEIKFKNTSSTTIERFKYNKF